MESFLGGFTKSRTMLEVWDIGDVSIVFVAIKNIDMVVFH